MNHSAERTSALALRVGLGVLIFIPSINNQLSTVDDAIVAIERAHPLDSWRLKQKSRRGIRALRRLLVDSLPYPIPRESSVGSSITAVVVSP